jgi:type IV fimbrial biogenesis protein FimT
MQNRINGSQRANWPEGSRNSQAGFSIYDLMISTAVAGVLSIGAIGMAGLIQDTRMTSLVNQLMGDLNLARSESIKRHTPITLCKSNNGASCSDEAAWRDGWIVFTDHNKNREVDTDDVIIRAQQALLGNINLRYGETGTYTYVRYNSSGEASRAATFTFCDGRGADKAKAVIVYWTGRPRVSTKTSSNGPLTCT